MDLPSWNHTEEVADLLSSCNKGLSCLLIIHRNGAPCGITGLSYICIKHKFAYATVGILEQYQNAGIGKKALTIAEKLAFDQLSLHRLEAQIHCDNLASIALFEKEGYKKEGVMRENFCIEGTFFNSILFSKLV